MESKNSKKIIIITAVVLALVAALVVFFILNRPKPEISYDKLFAQIQTLLWSITKTDPKGRRK